ncbi:MAG: lipoate--protein ligase [Bacteroidales bacterium]|nr:lipoate--protein ligase [Bacteroidales bacterium]
MKLILVVSPQGNPYWNVAVENYLVSQQAQNQVVMYLWKNRRTVVIGQNQNPFAECNVDALLADGGYVMRRTTGGGAVYHDDGNINFSFVAPYDLYDQQRQFNVISTALRDYGLETEVSGRNDLLCNGRKFSGNAFSKGTHQRLHHGTILIKGNMDDLARYLKVKPAKLRKHGVESVQSRVVNLSELADITSDNIVSHLIAAFEKVYDGKVETIDFEDIIRLPEVISLYEKYSSDEWLFGKWRTFTASRSAQFDWGAIDLSLTIDEQHGIITDVTVATDALDVNLMQSLRKILIGSSLLKRPYIDPQNPTASMLKDVLDFLY